VGQAVGEHQGGNSKGAGTPRIRIRVLISRKMRRIRLVCARRKRSRLARKEIADCLCLRTANQFEQETVTNPDVQGVGPLLLTDDLLNRRR